jgi:Domain of unknown function (DUF4390)
VPRGLAVFALLSFGAARPAAAQDPALTISLQAGVPRVRAVALLANGKFVALMRSGLPLRLHYRLELWRARSGWFDEHVSETAWDAVAHYDPLADDFVLVRTGGAATRYASVDALAHALELPYHVALAPKDAGHFYYLVRLEISTLNDTDLQELERWLRGEVSPAVSGHRDLGSALTRGVQRLLVRIAGLPRLTLEARSESFRRER